MSYSPFTWSDDSAGNTPLTAFRLNAMEQGIAHADSSAGLVQTTNTQIYTSGAGFNITMPTGNAGTIFLHGSAGGAWDTFWYGAWVTNQAGNACQLNMISTGTTGPGNLFSSVNGSGSYPLVIVALNTPGGTCVIDWTITRSVP